MLMGTSRENCEYLHLGGAYDERGIAEDQSLGSCLVENSSDSFEELALIVEEVTQYMLEDDFQTYFSNDLLN